MDLIITKTLFGEWQITTSATFFALEEDTIHNMTFPEHTFRSEKEIEQMAREMLVPEYPQTQIYCL